jgi:hypothetical protein
MSIFAPAMVPGHPKEPRNIHQQSSDLVIIAKEFFAFCRDFLEEFFALCRDFFEELFAFCRDFFEELFAFCRDFFEELFAFWRYFFDNIWLRALLLLLIMLLLITIIILAFLKLKWHYVPCITISESLEHKQ